MALPAWPAADVPVYIDDSAQDSDDLDYDGGDRSDFDVYIPDLAGLPRPDGPVCDHPGVAACGRCGKCMQCGQCKC